MLTMDSLEEKKPLATMNLKGERTPQKGKTEGLFGFGENSVWPNYTLGLRNPPESPLGSGPESSSERIRHVHVLTTRP